MNGLNETKSEIRAHIDELQKLRGLLSISSANRLSLLDQRHEELLQQLESAKEDLSSSILRSHKAICEVK